MMVEWIPKQSIYTKIQNDIAQCMFSIKKLRGAKLGHDVALISLHIYCGVYLDHDIHCFLATALLVIDAKLEDDSHVLTH
jgi:hypothetical protein